MDFVIPVETPLLREARDKIKAAMPLMTEVMGLSTTPCQVRLDLMGGGCRYKMDEKTIELAVAYCYEPTRYFKTKFQKLSVRKVEPMLFAFAHELGHFRQEMKGELEKRYGVYYFRGKEAYPGTSMWDSKQYHKLPVEVDANKWAKKVCVELHRELRFLLTKPC